jgi:hypothetical protein
LFGEADVGNYPFLYTMPKNYSCDSHSSRKSSFTVSFAFGIRIVLKNGIVVTKNTPITIYREKQGEETVKEVEEQEEEGKED